MVLGLARSALVCALALHAATATPLATNTSSSRAGDTVSTGDLIGWFNCSSLTFADQAKDAKEFLGPPYSQSETASYAQKAQCAQYQAPLCHEGICDDTQGRTIDVFVKRVLSHTKPETKPNVWFFQGGPGAASPTMEYGMLALYMELSGNVNVYTMDHRGTGRSTPLNCVAAQATTSGSPSGDDIDIREFAACAQELQTKYGDMAAFSVTSAATDIASFITKYQAGSKTFVYGVSYGSALVERLLHLAPPEIVGYVLDGIATTSGAPVTDGMYMSNWDTNFAEVTDRYLKRFETNSHAEASRKFGSKSIASVLKRMFAALDKSPDSRCATLFTEFVDPTGATASRAKPSTVVRQFLGKLLMNAITRTLIPVLVYRLDRCSKDDHIVLQYFLKLIGQSLGDASEEDALQSMLQYYIIVFSEMWETPTPDAETLLARFTAAGASTGPIARLLPLYCAFTHDVSPACAAHVNATVTGAGPPLAYKKDKYWNVAATIPKQASVLLLSGKLDPQTPHKYAERLFKALDGSRKQLVTFEYGTHGALLSAVYTTYGPSAGQYCGVEVFASFVNSNGSLSKLSTNCVAMTNEYAAALDPDPRLQMFFGTKTDMYDGELEGHYTKKLLAPLLVAIAVAVAAAVWLAVVVYRRFKARKAAASDAGIADATVLGDALHTQSPSNTEAPFLAPQSKTESRV